MTKNKTWIIGFFACVALVAFFITEKPSEKKPSKVIGKATPVKGNGTFVPSTPAMLAATPGERGATPESKGVDKELLRWFAMESQHIQARNVDTLASEADMKKRAARFQAPEIKYLASRASSPLVPAGERILASYLLGLAAEKSATALVDNASQAIENPGPHEPHSVDEARAAQERAYRIMSVDAIFNSDSEVSKKIDQLNAIVNKSPDTTIKKYAADKVEELHDTL